MVTILQRQDAAFYHNKLLEPPIEQKVCNQTKSHFYHRLQNSLRIKLFPLAPCYLGHFVGEASAIWPQSQPETDDKD